MKHGLADERVDIRHSAVILGLQPSASQRSKMAYAKWPSAWETAKPEKRNPRFR